MRNVILLAASLLFYAWGEPIYVSLMIFSAVADYFHGRMIYKYKDTHKVRSKIALISSITLNVAILSFFKYADFLVENINLLLGTSISSMNLPLPIGISFYTFQTMSYCIDIYKGKMIPQKDPIAVATYVCLFPQLIAGPIVRYESIAHDLLHRKWNGSQFSEGVQLFIIGLGKKVLLANNIGALWNSVQAQQTVELSLMTVWLGLIAFSFQIYFDFSGYSDMAVGLGKMFGFHFPRNFHYPYIAKTVTDFWRRWHITLGGWFRDYVYIPLGGNRRGKFLLYRNLFIVWGLTGLWHGASWNFVIWGLYFGVLIALEKAGLVTILEKLPKFIQHIYLLVIIMLGWVLFVFEDVDSLIQYLKIMFALSTNPFIDTQFLYYFYTNIVLIVICSISATPIWEYMKRYCSNRSSIFQAVLLSVFNTGILVLSTAYLVDESYNPFLYFRF